MPRPDNEPRLPRVLWIGLPVDAPSGPLNRFGIRLSVTGVSRTQWTSRRHVVPREMLYSDASQSHCTHLSGANSSSREATYFTQQPVVEMHSHQGGLRVHRCRAFGPRFRSLGPRLYAFCHIRIVRVDGISVGSRDDSHGVGCPRARHGSRQRERVGRGELTGSPLRSGRLAVERGERRAGKAVRTRRSAFAIPLWGSSVHTIRCLPCRAVR